MTKDNVDRFPKLHKIQWNILTNMSLREYSRFNELKPKEMDPKQFTYHLNRLKGFELVAHDDRKRRYYLTDNGKLIIGHYENLPGLEEMRIQTYVLLYIKRDRKLLVVKRNSSPYLGFIGNPISMIERDKYINESASELLSSIGLTGNLSLNLILEMIYKNEKNEVRTHAFIYIFYTKDPKGESVGENEEGELSWMSQQELLKVEKGYDNSKDIVDYFESEDFTKDKLKMISRTYSTPW